MAGGIGSRFWPYSRNQYPKQFLDILGTGKSLLKMTYDRLTQIVKAENILIISHQDYKSIVQDQIPQLPFDNLVCEPLRKNTAPCSAMAAQLIMQKDSDAIILTAPADHLILQEDQFVQDILEGVEFLKNNDALLTLGIQVSRPDTGYGYIHLSDSISSPWEIYNVLEFVEKPNYNTALAYMQSGNYVWNSGIFLWKASTIWNEFEQHASTIAEVFREFSLEKLQSCYERTENISIDFAIMEKSSKVFSKRVDFGWSDLGTWGSIYNLLPQDEKLNATVSSDTLLYEVERSIIHNHSDQIMVLQGLDDYIVVNTKDALLVCKKSEEQRIKQMLTDVQAKFGGRYL